MMEVIDLKTIREKLRQNEDRNLCVEGKDTKSIQACWDAINNRILKGPLQGNGCDKAAERNGLVLAANIISDLMVAK